MIFFGGSAVLGGPPSVLKVSYLVLKGFSSEFKGHIGYNFFVKNVGGLGGLASRVKDIFI